jgi:predicted MFS family arabinose efflux permease
MPLLRSPASPTPPWSLYSPWQRWGFLTILFLVTTSNYFDYFVLSVVLDPIKHEFHVSDTMLGLLSGFCFSLFYAIGALPISRWADRGNRRTVITVSLAGWSVMTAVCGFAQTFWQLALARLGVGAMEPGALPPAQSLVADYFPSEKRATAIAILTQGGSAVGYLVGVALGGYIAATRGWRAAFFLAGAPGLALAVIVRLALPEPRCRLGFPSSGPEAENVRQTLSRLRCKQSFLLALGGLSAYTIFSYGVSVFLPSFMIRVLHATLEQVSTTWGFAISAANLAGAIGGGWLADRLSRRDIRWYAWLPTIACVLAAPIYWLALASHHLWTFIGFDFLAETIISIGIPAYFAAIHAVCGNRRRVMAVTIVLFCITLFGSTIGPLAAGVLSDALSSVYGLESLRYSLFSMLLFLIPAGVCFYWFAREMPRDLED